MTPGIYDIPAEQYHADPALSASGVRRLTEECPAVFAYERATEQHKRCFDIGTAGHLMMLEPDRFDAQVQIVQGYTKDGKPSKGYATQDARDQQEAAYAAGKTPLLPEEVEMVRAMRAALWQDPVAKHAFSGGGEIERSVFWQDAEFGIACRTRPDLIAGNGRYLINYKTAASAHPSDVQKAMHNFGWHQKAAWEMDGLAAIGRPVEAFAFAVQAKKPPFLVSTHWLDITALYWGRQHNRLGKAIFARCTATGHWPGYQPDPLGAAAAFTTRLPGWAENDYTRRDEAGEFDVQPEQRAAA